MLDPKRPSRRIVLLIQSADQCTSLRSVRQVGVLAKLSARQWFAGQQQDRLQPHQVPINGRRFGCGGPRLAVIWERGETPLWAGSFDRSHAASRRAALRRHERCGATGRWDVNMVWKTQRPLPSIGPVGDVRSKNHRFQGWTSANSWDRIDCSFNSVKMRPAEKQRISDRIKIWACIDLWQGPVKCKPLHRCRQSLPRRPIFTPDSRLGWPRACSYNPRPSIVLPRRSQRGVFQRRHA